MKYLRSFFGFWWHFILGDDWRVAHWSRGRTRTHVGSHPAGRRCLVAPAPRGRTRARSLALARDARQTRVDSSQTSASGAGTACRRPQAAQRDDARSETVVSM